MRIAVISTSRADWAGLGMVAQELKRGAASVVVFAPTDHPGLADIRADMGSAAIYGPSESGLPLDGEAAVRRMGRALNGLAGALASMRPDLAVVCGDRHETLFAAAACAVMGVPLAHLAGGDVTAGSSDELYRHAITKLSHLHFPTNAASARRLTSSLGERPEEVFMEGSPAVDRIMRMPLLPRNETTAALGLPDSRAFILANWQPAGMDKGLGMMLFALGHDPRPTVIVGPNPDPGAYQALKQIETFCRNRPDARQVRNLPLAVYLSAMAAADFLIGNSSSGFYEAPYLGTPVINIGDRQRGRAVPECLAWCPEDADQISGMIAQAAGRKFAPQAPYGDGHSAPKIAAAIIRYAAITGPKAPLL